MEDFEDYKSLEEKDEEEEDDDDDVKNQETIHIRLAQAFNTDHSQPMVGTPFSKHPNSSIAKQNNKTTNDSPSR
ncbi:hypothetical protein PT974_11726 [Cladobotryum mycophilum]|uniref:Uncharacterized protein n=1 Tax=Cladobotryum mycophilum TaxID=491253 RepID=A0ABR0S5Z3_9HYPO